MLSAALKHLKEQKKITTQQLAEKSGYPASTISRILSGETVNPGFNVICDLVQAMGGSLDELADFKKALAAQAKPQQQPTAATPVQTPTSIEKILLKENEEKTHLIRILLITSGVLAAILIGILLFDLFNGSFGFFRY